MGVLTREETGVCKRVRSFFNSPDGGDYPFVLGFKTKDSANQQELPLLAIPGDSLLIMRI